MTMTTEQWCARLEKTFGHRDRDGIPSSFVDALYRARPVERSGIVELIANSPDDYAVIADHLHLVDEVMPDGVRFGGAVWEIGPPSQSPPFLDAVGAAAKRFGLAEVNWWRAVRAEAEAGSDSTSRGALTAALAARDTARRELLAAAGIDSPAAPLPPAPDEVGKGGRRSRTICGRKVKDIAAALGVTSGTVIHWLDFSRSISLASAREMATFCGVSLDDLVAAMCADFDRRQAS